MQDYTSLCAQRSLSDPPWLTCRHHAHIHTDNIWSADKKLSEPQG